MTATYSRFIGAVVASLQLLAANAIGAQVLPDLHGTAVRVVSGGLRGEMVAISATFGNRGTGAAPSSWRGKIYLSRDTSITETDLLVWAWTAVISLPAGASTTQTISFPVPGNTPWGLYHVGLVLDPDNDVAESLETNNTLSTPLTVGTKTDLSVTAVSTPATVVKGAPANVTITVSNIGSETLSDPIPSDLYLSADQTFATGDLAVGTFTVPAGLGPGASATVTAQFIVPVNIQLAAPWYVIAFVDGPRWMPERNEDNNTFSSATPMTSTAAHPIMLPSIVSAPDAAYSGAMRGEKVRVEVSVVNQGTAPSSETWRTRYFLSTNSTINGATEGVFGGAKDWLLREFTVSAAIGTGSTQSLSHEVQFPARLTSGSYFLGVQIDRAGEQGSGGATAASSIKITKPGDLVPVSVSAPAQVDVRSSFDVTVSVTNRGPATVLHGWTSRIVLANLSGIVVHDLGQHDFGIGQLLSGAAATGKARVTLPASVGVGDYRVVVSINDTKVVYEETTSGQPGEENNSLNTALIRVR